MNPRSLVGATMGARKRAARRDAVLVLMDASPRPWMECDNPGEYFHDPCCWLYPRHTLDALRRLLEYRDATPEGVCAAIIEQRAKYRIGERLRPCVGCLSCAQPCAACENEEFEGTVCERCGREHVVHRICDGSGVLSAGKQKRRAWACVRCKTRHPSETLHLATAVCACGVGAGTWELNKEMLARRAGKGVG